jgi:hypothetical protein
MIDRLLKAIATGAPYNICATACGITPDAFHSWRREDPDFAAKVDRVASKTALRLVKKIEWHGKANWAAMAWLLERRYPHDFSKPEVQFNLAIQNNNGGATNTIVLGPERASVLANRYAEIREKTKRMVDGETKRPVVDVEARLLGNGETPKQRDLS